MFKQPNHLLAFMCAIFCVLLTACTSQQPAKVVYHIDEYYGYEKTYGETLKDSTANSDTKIPSQETEIEDISQDYKVYGKDDESYGPSQEIETKSRVYGPVIDDSEEKKKQKITEENAIIVAEIDNITPKKPAKETDKNKEKTELAQHTNDAGIIEISETSHTVNKGDTLYSLSRKYNIPILPIIIANGLKAPYGLNKGQIIKIPEAKFHIVAEKDTLYSISRKYQADMTSLAKINDLEPPYSIFKGQKLQIPFPSYSAKNDDKKSASTKLEKEIKKKTEVKSKAIKKEAKNKTTTKKPVKKEVAGFIWPAKGKIIKKFGGNGNNHSDGINIKAKTGTDVLAVKSGKVVYVGDSLKSFGNLAIIKHDNGLLTAYAHMEKVMVKKDEKVRQHQTIGKVGQSGKVTSPQLYFAVRKGKTAINPMKYLKK